MSKPDYIKKKARELGITLLALIKEVKPSTRRLKPTSKEVSSLNSRLSEYFDGYSIDELDELYDEIVKAFKLQKEKASKGGNELKYFRLDTIVRPANFHRTIEWNLEELGDTSTPEGGNTGGAWDYYKNKNVNFSEEDF